MDTNESGFENGGRVPITTPEELDREIVHDSLSQQFNYGEAETSEIQAIVEDRIQAEMGRIKEHVELAKSEAVGKLLRLIIDAKTPRRAAYQIAYAIGMGSLVGGSAIKISKTFGISKQAFDQEGDRMLASLDIRKNALQKSPEASKKYSQTNYRK